MAVSIFNDVIGPVMRGPSSSHCAAALRIGHLARDLMEGRIRDVSIAFDRNGSLATTHTSQGSDMGLCAGLLGWDTTDERMPDAMRAAVDAGMNIEITVGDLKAEHPNTYRLVLSNAHEKHLLVAVSTGGGMIEVVHMDGFPVSLTGDCQETLIYTRSDGPAVVQYLRETGSADEVLLHEAENRFLVEVKTPQCLDMAIIGEMKNRFSIQQVKELAPVLPVLSRLNLEVPFVTCEQMLDYRGDNTWDLGKMGLAYEAMRGDLAEQEVLERMIEIVSIVRASVQQGLRGTDYPDRMLGYQSGLYAQHLEQGKLLDAGLLNRIILYVSALMEVKSAMGVIVAAPTAGACAALPGACLAVGDQLGLSDDQIARGLLAAGVIGVFIAGRSTFAAEVAGCQAECGAASGMAAAALVTLGGGTTEQAVAAASMALQNSLGMICDPVAKRVEVPCLGKNVMAAGNALSSANMALAGFDPVIPLDEVIETLDRVGRSLPHELRCTALGGLSVTRTSKAIEQKMKKRRQ
jgi:L-serine dehydratase